MVPWRALWTGRSWFNKNRCTAPVVRIVVGTISWIGCCWMNRGVVWKFTCGRCCSKTSPFSSVVYRTAGSDCCWSVWTWGNCCNGCCCCCGTNVGTSTDSFSSVTGLASSLRLFGFANGGKVFARAGACTIGRRARRNPPFGPGPDTKRSLRYWIGCRLIDCPAPAGIANRGTGPNCEFMPVRQ